MSRLLICLFAVSAAGVPALTSAPNDLLRAANDAIRRRDHADALTLLTHCEERSADPGLIAFNRGVMFFEAEEYREAEVNFLRCLDDQAIPEERFTLAIYNRGVCLVRRGEDEKLLRSAISCFEQCLDHAAVDSPLSRDARHNLELTKLLWNQARAKQSAPPTPNEQGDDPPPRAPETQVEEGGQEMGNPPETKSSPITKTPTPQPQSGNNPMTPTPSTQKTNGAGDLPLVRDDATTPQAISPDDTNRLLDRAEARLRTARQRNEQLRAGPERPNVRDW